eukprot:1054444-Pelagomonas_calceolata.AAC.1
MPSRCTQKDEVLKLCLPSKGSSAVVYKSLCAVEAMQTVCIVISIAPMQHRSHCCAPMQLRLCRGRVCSGISAAQAPHRSHCCAPM